MFDFQPDTIDFKLDFQEDAPEATWGQAVKQKLVEAAGAADSAISLPAAGLAGVFSRDAQDEIFRGLDERKRAGMDWANPEHAPLSTAQQIGGTIATLPAQALGMFGSAAEKGMDLIKRNEPLSRAIPATLGEAAMTAAGAGPTMPAKTLLGRAAIGAGANVSFGAGADALTQQLATQESTKEAYNPYDLNKRLVEGVTGGVLQGAVGERPTVKAHKNPLLNKMREQESASVEASKNDVPVGTQHSLFDFQPDEGLASPHDAGQQGITEPTGLHAKKAQMDLQLEHPETLHVTKDEVALPASEVNAALHAKGVGEDRMIAALEEPSPAAQKASDAVAKQVEAIQELRSSIKDGTANPHELIAAMSKLEALKERASIIEGNSSFNKRTRGQGGAIDPSVFLGKFPEFATSKIKDAFGQLKAVYHGTTKSFSDFKNPNVNAIQKLLGQDKKGTFFFADNPEFASGFAGKLSGSNVHQSYLDMKNPLVMEAYKTPESVATAIERAKKSGNDGVVVHGWKEFSTPTTMYIAFDNKQIKSAISPNSIKSPGNKQRGGLYMGEPKPENAMLRSADGTFIPHNPDIKAALSEALSEGKDGKLWTYTQSGATSAAMKTGSAAIRYASRVIQNGVKRAEKVVRERVFPVETALRGLSRDEIVSLADVFRDEMFQGRRFSDAVLVDNLSVKQIQAYTHVRKMFDDTLAAQNSVRKTKGLPEVSPKEAYLSSRWDGDFRRPIHTYTLDKNGNKQLDEKGNPKTHIVWYLASNSKRGLEKQSNALGFKFPDLIIDPKKDHTVRSLSNKTELQSMYTTMLDILGRNDPAIEKIKQAIEEQMTEESQGAFGQDKHFEDKHNVRGFVGDRPGAKNPVKESLAMFEQQIQYAKNAYTWAEMQKSADDLKGLLSDEKLQEQQPNNVKYIQEYFKNSIGYGEAKVISALNDTIRDGLGISPKIISHGVAITKSTFILQKLAASTGYTLANMVQTSNVMPYLADLRAKGYKGNPVTAMAVGVPAGMMMAVSHYLKAAGGAYVDRLPSQFLKDAVQYAEDNGVTARSVYDESPVSSSFSRVANVVNVANKTITIPETLVRSVAFMTYAQMLKDSGKFTDSSKLFQMAEEYVNKSMVDYRETERPLMFGKMGAAGNFLNTLQTYPMSFYNQYAYMAGEAVKGSPVPLLTALALQTAVSGAMGVPYVEDAYKLFGFVRDHLPVGMYASMQDSPLLSDPKMWMMETLGRSSVYGALSENTGLGLTSRVAAPGMGAMLQSPAGPITDLAQQAGNLGSAVLDPTNTTKWAQAAMSSAPVGLAGLLETSPMMEGHTYTNRPDGTQLSMKVKGLASRNASYARTPQDVTIRKAGIRSQGEVVARDLAYATSSANQVMTKKSGELITKYYDAARRGKVQEAKKYAEIYVNLTGKGISDKQMETQIHDETKTDFEKNVDKSSSTPRKLQNAARMAFILRENK